jgi:superfamily I DNA and/or RNA helicase
MRMKIVDFCNLYPTEAIKEKASAGISRLKRSEEVPDSPYTQDQLLNKIIDESEEILVKILESSTADRRPGGETRNKLQTALINNSRIICTTLSMAGHRQIRNIKNNIEYLIIDEAC